LTVRVKIEALALGPLKALGSGGDYEISVYSSGITNEMGGNAGLNEDALVGDDIAHELKHALGGDHTSAANFIDSATFPSTIVGTGFYSPDGEKFVVEALKLPLK
jgi:hypothetical protein